MKTVATISDTPTFALPKHLLYPHQITFILLKKDRQINRLVGKKEKKEGTLGVVFVVTAAAAAFVVAPAAAAAAAAAFVVAPAAAAFVVDPAPAAAAAFVVAPTAAAADVAFVVAPPAAAVVDIITNHFINKYICAQSIF